MTPDPIADQFSDITPYHYTHNNPVNRIDPDGQKDKSAMGWAIFKGTMGVLSYAGGGQHKLMVLQLQ